MENFDGTKYYDKKDYFNITKDILLGRDILLKRLKPKTKKNDNTDINYKLGDIIDDYNYTQEVGINYHYIQHIYRNGIVLEKNLIGFTTISFDVDIGDDKLCKNRTELYTRIRLLKKNYGFIPHILVRSTGGYHLYFNLETIIDYSKHKIIIDKVYNFLISELLGDEGFSWKISRLKMIGSYDYNNKFESPEKNVVVIEKVNNHKKYNLQDLYDLYNKITGNKRTIEDSEIISINKKEKNNNYRRDINDLCPYEITKRLGIFDEKNKCLKGNPSVSIYKSKINNKYHIKEHNGGKIDLFQVILNHFEGDFGKFREFIYSISKIKYVNTSDYYEIPRIIVSNILYGNYKVDESKLKLEFGENYKEIIEKNKVLEKNGKLNYKVIFILLNLISLYSKKNNNIKLDNIKFKNIFINTNQNIYKDDLLIYFKIIKSLYTEINNYNINRNIVEKVYLIDNFYENGKDNYNISALNLLFQPFFVNKLKNIPFYIPKKILNLNKKLSTFIILIMIKSEIKKDKFISYEEIYNSLGKTYNFNYIRDIKLDILKIFTFFKKNIKTKYSFLFEKDRFLLEELNFKKLLQNI